MDNKFTMPKIKDDLTIAIGSDRYAYNIAAVVAAKPSYSIFEIRKYQEVKNPNSQPYDGHEWLPKRDSQGNPELVYKMVESKRWFSILRQTNSSQ